MFLLSFLRGYTLRCIKDEKSKLSGMWEFLMYQTLPSKYISISFQKQNMSDLGLKSQSDSLTYNCTKARVNYIATSDVWRDNYPEKKM